MVKKSFKIIAVLNIFLLIISLVIVRDSKYSRQYEELFSHIMVFGWGIWFTSIIWSGVNTLLIYDHIKDKLKKNIIWLLISSLPMMYLFIILISVLFKTQV